MKMQADIKSLSQVREKVKSHYSNSSPTNQLGLVRGSLVPGELDNSAKLENRVVSVCYD